MQYRELGNSGVMVSEVSLGCWTMGGLNFVNGVPNGWANVDENEVKDAIKFAVEQGVNHFDNADVYGNGRAERMLAKCFDDLGLVSTDYVIASKVGHFPGTAANAYEPRHIRNQCEQSLANLNREYLDVYYFHHGNFGEGDYYLDDAVEILNRLVEEGKVRVKGQSAYSSDDFERVTPKVQPQVLQSWGHALDDQFVRPGSRVSKLMAEQNMSFVAFSPLAQGVLLDKFDPENPPQFEEGDNRKNRPRFQRDELLKLRPKLAQLKERFGDTTDDLAAIAIRYILSMPNVACAIPGFRNLRQVQGSLTATDRVMSEADVEFVQKIFAP
jgi:aryl-alcohol dehydrogenase-like predicted oxidoreductase